MNQEARANAHCTQRIYVHILCEEAQLTAHFSDACEQTGEDFAEVQKSNESSRPPDLDSFRAPLLATLEGWLKSVQCVMVLDILAPKLQVFIAKLSFLGSLDDVCRVQRPCVPDAIEKRKWKNVFLVILLHVSCNGNISEGIQQSHARGPVTRS